MTQAAYLGHLTGRFCPCANLAKVRRKPRFKATPVARYVAQRHNRVSRAVTAAFNEWAHKAGKEIRAAAERAGLGKALSPADQLLKDVLDALDIEGMSQDIADELYPEMRKAFKKAGVQSSKDLLGKTSKHLVQQMDKQALAYAKKRAAELVGKSGGEWSISGATRNGLRNVVAKAIKEGWSPQQLSNEIEDSYTFSPSRADTIARTELAMAHVEGNVQGWRETGFVDRKRSILGDLHEAIDDCDDNAEEGAVDLDDEFPSGHKFPPYHPNCVCDVVPVLKDEDE